MPCQLGTNVQPPALYEVPTRRGARMVRRHGIVETLQSARKQLIIKEIQAAIARELAARSEVPKTVPKRIADLLRELHRRLRDPSQDTPRLDGAHHDRGRRRSAIRGRGGIER